MSRFTEPVGPAAATWTIPLASFPSRETPRGPAVDGIVVVWGRGRHGPDLPGEPDERLAEQPSAHNQARPWRRRSVARKGLASLPHTQVCALSTQRALARNPESLTERRAWSQHSSPTTSEARSWGGLEDTMHKIILPPLSMRIAAPTWACRLSPRPRRWLWCALTSRSVPKDRKRVHGPLLGLSRRLLDSCATPSVPADLQGTRTVRFSSAQTSLETLPGLAMGWVVPWVASPAPHPA